MSRIASRFDTRCTLVVEAHQEDNMYDSPYDPGIARYQATDRFLAELEQENHERRVRALQTAAVVGAGALLFSRLQHAQFQESPPTPEVPTMQRQPGETEAHLIMRQLNVKYTCGSVTYRRWYLVVLTALASVLTLSITFPYSEIGIAILVAVIVVGRKSKLITDSGKLEEK
jgi:hypothetical protein